MPREIGATEQSRMPAVSAELTALLPALHDALALIDSNWRGAVLTPLADKGLAHHHVSLVGTGILARIPKQSQLQLDALTNLSYQSACFARASESGHAPRLHATLPPQPTLPRGALLVDEIRGRTPRLPDDLPAIVTALARIHSLPLPLESERPPLWDHVDPLAALEAEIEAQARYLGRATLTGGSRAIVDRELARLTELLARPDRPEKALISFDAHPGNFLIRPDGEAVLVDLEKCRYSYPALDLAHATLYTSTTWEPDIVAVLSPFEVVDCYRRWAEVMDGDPAIDWQLPLRRAMWLWSVTWCAKWRVLSGRDAATGADGEDWSSTRSADVLTEHVRGRVDHYLDPAVIGRISAEFDEW